MTVPSASRTLRRYAIDTWASLAAMTDSRTGLPADHLSGAGERCLETSVTNIGAYLWSAVVAERLGLAEHFDVVTGLATTLLSLETMDRDVASGMYPNWSDHTSRRTLTRWPSSGEPITPVLSSVDNAWLAVGLRVVAASVPELATRARALADAMHFGVYYRPALNRIAILDAPGRADPGACYDTIVSESRMATYLGIVAGEIPARAYFGTCRTLPGAHDQQGREARGITRTYLGVPVFEGSFEEAGAHVVPSWAGSMFEELMPALFVPEESWGPRSWGVNHQLTVDAQIRHGLATTGYWGSSPCHVQGDGYVVTGLDALAMNRDDHPAAGGRSSAVVTPHASFLALRWAPAAALSNLARLERDFPIYDRFGFRDSVDVRTSAVSDSYLAVDQGMIMAALGNALGDDMLRRAFATASVSRALRPLLGLEEFGDGADQATPMARSRLAGHRGRAEDGSHARTLNEPRRARHVGQRLPV